MWDMIPSLRDCVDTLAPAFTQPSFASNCRLLLAWVMCLGKHTLSRAGENTRPQVPPDHSQRHGLDAYYNFFERSSWTPKDLAFRIAVLILTRLPLSGRITLLVDDTLAHKRGKSAWGLGWWRDAGASTRKRVATASGHNWVVMAVAFRVPGTSRVILALPLLAGLHLPGKGQLSCAELAKEMLDETLGWFPGRGFTLVADGAYACKEVLGDFPQAVRFVGRMRGDAAVYDPKLPRQKEGKRGPKPKKGPRLPSPRDAAEKAGRKRPGSGDWGWQEVGVTIYGSQRTLLAVSYQAVWPRVLGLVPAQIVAVRDPEGRMDDVYLFTTDLGASLEWTIETILVAVVDRGAVQSQQTGAADRGPAALLPRERGEGGPVGLGHAGGDHGVVSHGRSGTAPGAADEATDGAVGQRVLLAPHDPGVATRHPRRHDSAQLGLRASAA